MAYITHDFKSGEVLTAESLNQMDNQILELTNKNDLSTLLEKIIVIKEGIIYAIINGEETKLLTINDLKDAMLTGIPTTTTPESNAPNNQIANVEFVKSAIELAELGGGSGEGISEEAIRQLARDELKAELSKSYNYEGIYTIK